MATQKEIDEALKLMAAVKKQREKQQNRWKEIRQIAEIVIAKAQELGRQGAYVDWIKSVMDKQTKL